MSAEITDAPGAMKSSPGPNWLNPARAPELASAATEFTNATLDGYAIVPVPLFPADAKCTMPAA